MYLSRRQWTCLPILTEVINVLHTLAKTDKAKKGVNYNDGIPTPDCCHEIMGVHTDNAGVQDNENDYCQENENDSLHETTGVQENENDSFHKTTGVQDDNDNNYENDNNNYVSYNRYDNHENGSGDENGGDQPDHPETTDETTAKIPGDGIIATIFMRTIDHLGPCLQNLNKFTQE